MKKSRFTESQILRVLQSQQEGSKVVEIGIRYFQTDILELEKQIWRYHTLGTSAGEGAGIGKCPPQSHRSRPADSSDILKEINSKKW